MTDFFAAVSAEPGVFVSAIALLVLFAAKDSLLAGLRGLLDARRAERARGVIDLPVRDAMPDYADCEALSARAAAAWDARDAAAIAAILQETTGAMEDMSDGSRNYDVAVYTMLRPVIEAGGLMDMAAPLAEYRRLHLAEPENAMLLGLYLRALQSAAWRAQGAYEGRHPTPERMAAFVRLLQEIEATVQAARIDPATSILFAEPWYHAGALRGDPARELDMRFELVLGADDGNFRLWTERAHHLLPGWFGSERAIGALMERAIRATRGRWGESVMVNIVLTVMYCIDVETIPGYSDARLMGAVADLATEPSGQADVNGMLAQITACRWPGLPEAIMRRHVTEIYAPAWDSETRYLALFDRAFGGRPSGRPAEDPGAAGRMPAE